MPKLNYFDSLECLSILASRAVFLACSSAKEDAPAEMCGLRESADRHVCELENSLFGDFLPPLERNSIAACAHAIVRIMDRCSEIVSFRNTKNFFGERKNKEAELCIRLVQLIEENIFRLRKIKKPTEIPDLSGFRCLLRETRQTHIAIQRKMSSGTMPKEAQLQLALYGKLRNELGRCFDDIVEIMLTNI